MIHNPAPAVLLALLVQAMVSLLIHVLWGPSILPVHHCAGRAPLVTAALEHQTRSPAQLDSQVILDPLAAPHARLDTPAQVIHPSNALLTTGNTP